MGRIRNFSAMIKKTWKTAKRGDDVYSSFNRNYLLYDIRITLELFDEYYDGNNNYEFKFGVFQRGLDGEFSNSWGFHLDAEEVKRFAKEWREDDLYNRVLCRDKSAFDGYSLDFISWLTKMLHTVVIYADTGFFSFAAFDREFKNRLLSWSGWRQNGVSWAED